MKKEKSSERKQERKKVYLIKNFEFLYFKKNFKIFFELNFQELANKALSKINAESNSVHYLAANIVKAESQVVAGVLYILKLRVGTSNCLKNVREMIFIN